MDKGVFDMIAESVKISGAAVAFAVGISQYRRAQKWKKREFIATQIKEIEAEPKVRAAFEMLDWVDRQVELVLSPDAKAQLTWGSMTDSTVLFALLPHEVAVNGYILVEAGIRDCFDALFDRLSRLWHFVESELVSVDELRPYLNYWIKLIAEESARRHSVAFRSLLLNYIKFYEFDGAKKLIEAFGFSLAVRDDDLRAAFTQALGGRVDYVKRTAL